MKIIVAHTAGFCFGVDKAVQQVYNSLNNKPLYTYGPIIHNNQVVKDLADKGVIVVEDINQLDSFAKGTIIIRSHGVGLKELEAIKNKNFDVIDATCPYVKRIHKIVYEAGLEGQKVIIIGDKEHPEVKGIEGWCNKESYIIKDISDIDSIKLNQEDKYCLVTQTTFNYLKYKEIVNKLQNIKIRVMIYETICNSTQDRQKEAERISKMSTKMLVIGGKHSSNTQKLYNICKKQCDKTYHIETIEDLVLNVFDDNDIIGITAGASTPKNIIEEVIFNVRRTKL